MKKSVAIIGGGPAAMMLAAQLDERLFHVSMYEQNAAVGRKFLVAGKGGFNLTHAEALEDFTSRYSPSTFFAEILKQFSNTDFRQWLSDIGIQTYTGTSRRVFPIKGIKPIDVLNAVLKRLAEKQVAIHHHYTWQGFDEKQQLIFETPSGMVTVKADTVVFALGGSSWKVTGSDGAWTGRFSQFNVDIKPFQSSNCAFGIGWPQPWINKLEGQALKNCTFSCGGRERKGEAVLTAFGIEGSGVYPLSPEIRAGLEKDGMADICIDLKPGLSEEALSMRLLNKGRASLGKCLENDVKLNAAAIALLKACLGKEEFTDPILLASNIKRLRLKITSMAPLDEAISTVGGIALAEIDPHFQLKKLPGHYAIGEMLDWDAPTGGYLLQACFSMGHALAQHLNHCATLSGAKRPS